MKILFRQSTSIGDTFFTSHYMYHQKQKGNKVLAAITDLNSEIKSLYNHFNFIDEVIKIPKEVFLNDDVFLKFCKENDYKPCRYLIETDYLKEIKFNNLDLWFEHNTEPTIDSKNCIGFQVVSSTNYDRPIIPYLNDYISIVKNAGLEPIFFGTKNDEELFKKHYLKIYEMYYQNDKLWRFGKDTLLQTISNIRNLKGHIVFCSGTSPIASFQNVPILELWNLDQFQFFSSLVHYMMGSPIHHIMESFNVVPNRNLIEIFNRLKNFSKTFYGK